MEKLKSIKKEYLIGVGIAIVVIGLVILSFSGTNETVIFNPSTDEEVEEELAYFYVDIKGEVNNPGVYKVTSDYRLFQVVNLAGGLTTNADTLAINLSQKIRDELAIYVPSFEDEYERIVVVDVDEGLVNINTASLAELDTLPGVGPSTAQAIIDYRTETSFSVIEDITNVPGIGEATYEDIKNSITT